MELLRDEIRDLVEKTHEDVLSIYIATEPKAYEPQSNALQLRAALTEAEQLLDGHGFRSPEKADLLAPLRALLDDSDFWLHQDYGLALFRTATQTEIVKLPFPPAVATRWGRGPYVAPLFSHTVMHPRHALLAVSQDHIKLFSIAGKTIRQHSLDDVDIPLSLDEALRFDDLQKPDLQHHPVARSSRADMGAAEGGVAATERQHTFHGHGESGEGRKTQVEGFLRQVDKGIQAVLRGFDSPPLILAGVDYVVAIYGSVSGYPHLVEETVAGNPDGLRPEELLERAAPILAARRDAMITEVRTRFEERRAHDLGSDDIAEVVDAADLGRVETLIVRERGELWGRFDPQNRNVELTDRDSSGAVDLVDLAVHRTLVTDGAVHVLRDDDMPETTSPVCAVFRY